MGARLLSQEDAQFLWERSKAFGSLAKAIQNADYSFDPRDLALEELAEILNKFLQVKEIAKVSRLCAEVDLPPLEDGEGKIREEILEDQLFAHWLLTYHDEAGYDRLKSRAAEVTNEKLSRLAGKLRAAQEIIRETKGTTDKLPKRSQEHQDARNKSNQAHEDFRRAADELLSLICAQDGEMFEPGEDYRAKWFEMCGIDSNSGVWPNAAEIKRLRGERKLNQSQLRAAIREATKGAQISIRTIRRAEAGKRVSRSTMESIAKGLKVDSQTLELLSD